jgi:hypothetical protein
MHFGMRTGVRQSLLAEAAVLRDEYPDAVRSADDGDDARG